MNTAIDSLSNEIISYNVLGQSGIDYYAWAISLITLLILTFIIKTSFDRNSNTISNHKAFSNLFYLFALATFLIISVIKVSLVLSLGLVGALSIVRFRTAVKEPEQIVYLFLLIGVAISTGANQLLIAFVVTLVFYTFSHFISNTDNSLMIDCDYCKLVFSSKLDSETQNKLNATIESESEVKKVLRYSDDGSFTEMTLNVSFHNINSLNNFKNRLKIIDKEIKLHYLSSISS